jgi:hypothetical protein
MAELEVASLRAAVGEQQGSAAPVKFFGDRLAPLRRGGAVDDKGLYAAGAQLFRQGRLRFQELGEDHQASFAGGEGREQFALLLPAFFQGGALAPSPRLRSVGELLERVAPGGGAAASRLQEQAAPQAGLAGGQTGQFGAEFFLPLAPKAPLRCGRLEEYGFCAAGRQIEPGIRAGVADHDLAEQPAQFLRLARLAREFRIKETGSEFLRRGQLAGLEERDQVVKLFQ